MKARFPLRVPALILGLVLTVIAMMAVQQVPGRQAAEAAGGPLHYAANEGTSYTEPAALGYNLHDTNMDTAVINGLPAGSQALVWTGTPKCPTALSPTFTAFVDANGANPRIFGYYLVDEPSDTSQQCIDGIAAMADYIHAHSTFQKAVVLLTDYPGTYAAYSPSSARVDLVALDPYPCRYDIANRCDFTMIDKAVSAAEAAGVPQAAIVPVFQEFGDTTTWLAPTTAELQSILAEWKKVVPDPVFDFTYTWNKQPEWNHTDALSTRPDWQEVMKTYFGGTTPPPSGGVTIMGAGDIAQGGSYLPSTTSTGDLIRAANPDAVFTLGDNEQNNGTAAEYMSNYDPAWGSFKAKTHPTPGNHDYHSNPPAGYIGYFGSANVSNTTDGGLYYAWDVGNGWRAYALNTEIDMTGAELTWLKNDVAAHPGMHYIMYAHTPRYTSGSIHPSDPAVCPLWNALASTGGLEIVMGAHQHDYERFARMDCAGNQTASGARSFVVGTGGSQTYALDAPQAGSQARDTTDYGVLKLVLNSDSYAWSFIASGKGWNGSTNVDTGNAGKVIDSGTQPTHGTPGPANEAPVVNAGVDQTIKLPATATLDATVTDDGNPVPPGAVTTFWSKQSGPGDVTFENAKAVDTTASFSEAGTYVLQLSADDSDTIVYDTVTITVEAADGGGAGTVDRRITVGSDDAEQAIAGSMSLTSTDLELTTDGNTQQVVGTRFPNVTVPRGSTVTGAYIQFQVDEATAGASSLTVKAENSDNAPTYTSTRGSMTARAVTGSVPWTPPDWPTVGAAGTAQRTPDISSLVQAVVDRAGWAAGNAMAFQFSGTGTRTAVAYEGPPGGAPLLHISYITGGGGTNVAPSVNAGPDQTVTLPSAATLDGTVSDDGLPNPPGAMTTAWSTLSGPGTVTFGDAAAVDTTATFSTSGSYVLQLSASDSAATTTDTVTITVQPGGGGTNVAPSVNAGVDQTVTLPADAALDGTVTDDGLPNPPGTVTTTWSKESGPGTVTFANASAVDTSATFSVAGSYVLKLSADDSALTGSDTVTITVQPSGGGANVAPTVNAGADQTITLPSTATLDATVTDDGLPNPPATVTTTWTKLSGPGTVTFADAKAVDTTGTFSTAGVYVLQLAASDSVLTGTDTVTVTVEPGGGDANVAPSVNAGADQTITLPSTATLDTTVTDDGLPNPPGTVTTTWSKVSGPGTVTFAAPSAVDTTATFSAAGSYVLQLAADDSALTATDTVTVTVQPAAGPGALEVRVTVGSDDAEQRVGGSTTLNSSDLQMVMDGKKQQVVGMRFRALQIPKGATITKAYVQFQASGADTVATALTIKAENSDNTPTYTTRTGSITSRAVTGSVAWAPAPWPTAGAAGVDQRTADVSSLVQAVVSRTGWAPGNALALQVSGSGRRTAKSYEGSHAGAPLLHVEYTAP